MKLDQDGACIETPRISLYKVSGITRDLTCRIPSFRPFNPSPLSLGKIGPSIFHEMSAKFVLKRMETQEEMVLLFEVLLAANYDPYHPLMQVFFPVFGYTTLDIVKSKEEGQQRLWNDHVKMGEVSNWLYVEEVSTGKMVGCAQWEVHLKNPFPEVAERIETSWWPEGSQGKEFSEKLLSQVYGARVSWMARPHLALNWMCCIPTHRRQGVGSLIMQWGIDKAEKLGLEAYLEASPMGKPLYEKFGFGVLLMIAYDTTKPNADDEWRRLQHDLSPEPFFSMWRPAGGVWENAKKPWELGRS